MYACRSCRIPLNATSDGCALCCVVRRNLVVVGESEADRPSLAGVGNEVVRELRKQLHHVGLILKEDPNNAKAAPRLISIANTVSKVLESVRKLQEDGKDAVNAMSFGERADLFVRWACDLPAAYRRSLLERLADYEAQLAAPVPGSEHSVEPS
jgi:hypothetical protein